MENVFLQRREKLRQKLSEQGVDYAVINNPVNVLYLTGAAYNTRERFLALGLNVADGHTRLVLPTMDLGNLPGTDIEEMPYLDGEDYIGLLVQGLQTATSIGIEKDYLHYGRAEAIIERMHKDFAHLSNIAQLISAQRLLKDELEISLLQQACTVTDETLAAWKNSIQIGVKESELQFELIRQLSLREKASFSFEAQISSGPNTSVAHGIRQERTVKPGEQVLIDYGLTYGHYRADITRVFFAGQPEARWREIYQIVLAANLAGIAAIKPGEPISNVDKAARRVIEEAGYGEYFTHRTGHGIGLEVHEEPYARGDNMQLMVPGMVFTVEPGIYLPGLGGIRVEDDVLVTENGPQVLTQHEKDLEQIILPL